MHRFANRCVRFTMDVAIHRATTRFRLADCAFVGRESNPLACDERFLAPSFPPFQSLACRKHIKNAVKNRIWIAISVYILVVIIPKRLGFNTSLHTIL